MTEKFTLVLGGAASGKSAFAERLARESGRGLVYLASAQAHDEEMRARIDRHIARRGPDWTTIEVPMDPCPVLTTLTPAQTCLFDCATMWLSNQMLAGADIAAAQDRLLAAIAGCSAALIVVTNEVGHGIVPDNALGREFREAQGRLNIALAAQAGLVMQITAGLPLALKGALR